MGLQIGVIKSESVKTVVKLTLGAPVCQVRVETHLARKSSKPFIDGSSRACRVHTCGSGNMAILLARQFLIV